MITLAISSLWLGITVGLIIMLPLLLMFIAYTILAPNNMFVTFGRENRIMYIMAGERFTGKVIFPSKTLFIDEEYNIRELSELPKKERRKHQHNGFLGMYWVGIYPFRKIYFRRLQWSEWETVREGEDRGKRVIKVRDEWTPYLIAKPFEYVMILKEAEDKDGQPLDAPYSLILKPTHATRPIFDVDDSHGQVQTLSDSLGLQIVKQNTFDKLGADTDLSQEVNDDFSKLACSLNHKIPGRSDDKNLSDVLGYYVEAGKLAYVELAGKNKEELLKASTAMYVAKKKADAEVITAEGEKNATILKAEGKKQAGLLELDVKKAEMVINKEYFEGIKDIPGANNYEVAKQISQSKITTYAPGKDPMPIIDLKGGNNE